MNNLRKFWPLSFKTVEKGQLIVKAIIYTVVPMLFSIFSALVSDVLALSIIMNLLCYAVIYPYCLAGAVFTFLNFFRVGNFKEGKKEEPKAEEPVA